MRPGPTKRQQQAQERIHALLAELSELVGPNADGQAALEFDDPDDMPQGSVVLTEWVVVASWMDETGEHFVTRFPSHNLPPHHVSGLLHEGLWSFDG
jgi:hypothetical protein